MPDLFIGNSSPAVTTPSQAHIPSVRSLPLLTALYKNMDGIDGVSFANQDPDEIVVLFLRRAVITNLPWIGVAVLGLLIPVTFPFLFNQLAAFSVPTSFHVVLVGFYYLLIVGFALYQIVNWFYNISIVSNKKVVDVNYSRITAKAVATATIDAAADVTYHQNGFIQTLFNYGNVIITTESATAQIIFEHVPRPADIVATIIDLKQALPRP